MKKIEKKIRGAFTNGVEYFFMDNFKEFEFKSFNHGEVEFSCNIIEISYGRFTVEYDLKCLKSNVYNNCIDGVAVYHDTMEMTLEREISILTSDLFKELERDLLNMVEEIEEYMFDYLNNGYDNGEEFDAIEYADIYESFSTEVIDNYRKK